MLSIFIPERAQEHLEHLIVSKVRKCLGPSCPSRELLSGAWLGLARLVAESELTPGAQPVLSCLQLGRTR